GPLTGSLFSSTNNFPPYKIVVYAISDNTNTVPSDITSRFNAILFLLECLETTGCSSSFVASSACKGGPLLVLLWACSFPIFPFYFSLVCFFFFFFLHFLFFFFLEFPSF